MCVTTISSQCMARGDLPAIPAMSASAEWGFSLAASLFLSSSFAFTSHCFLQLILPVSLFLTCVCVSVHVVIGVCVRSCVRVCGVVFVCVLQ